MRSVNRLGERTYSPSVMGMSSTLPRRREKVATVRAGGLVSPVVDGEWAFA